jgi:hypothetical protein
MKIKKIEAYQRTDTEEALIVYMPSGFAGKFLAIYEDPYDELSIGEASSREVAELRRAIKGLNKEPCSPKCKPSGLCGQCKEK